MEANVLDPEPHTDLQPHASMELGLPASDPTAMNFAPPQSPGRDTPEGEYE